MQRYEKFAFTHIKEDNEENFQEIGSEENPVYIYANQTAMKLRDEIYGY